MAGHYFKGSISFGLVYIPVTLNNTVRNNDINFNLLDRQTMSRVKYKKTCLACVDREVKQEDLVKGYEYEEGKYVVFEDKDFEKIKSAKDKNIVIEKFVDLAQIDPLYFDKPYYVVPSGGEKAYAVLTKAMEQTGKAAIAKTVLGNKETLIAIRAREGKMLLNTLFFHEEVQKNPTKDVSDDVAESELKIAEAIIDSMSGAFEPEQYKDEYREKLEKAIEDKIAGKELSAPAEGGNFQAADLMDALKKSLEQVKKATGKVGRAK